MKDVRRWDVVLVALDPTVGAEMKKTRPCLVVSPDVANAWLRTVIVAPLTTRIREYPTRVETEVDGTPGQVALDQLRTVDKSRCLRRLGTVPPDLALRVSSVLVHMLQA